MKSLRQYREALGLADMQAPTDVSGSRQEIVNDLIELLTKNVDALRSAIMKHGEDSTELKQIIGLVSSLKDKPPITKKTVDPLSNVVARSHDSADNPGSGLGQDVG